MEPAARSFGVVAIDAVVLDDPADIEHAITEFAQQPNGGLIVPPNNVTQRYSAQIVGLAARYALPAVYFDRLFVDAGGLMSYGADQFDIIRRAASYVDRILRGVKPTDLAVQAPTNFELILNLKAAKTLSLTVPLSLRALATEVIE